MLNKSLTFNLKHWAAPALLGLICFLVYNANLRQIGSGDTLPARYLPLILWHDGTLNLKTNARLVAHGHSKTRPWDRPPGAEGNVAFFEPWAYWVNRTRQHQLSSLYPVVAPLMVAPLYLPAVHWLNTQGWEQPQIDRVAELMEKISASLLASVASVLMYLVLRRDCGRWSFPLALVFALGTNTWMISSQALWQHGSAELLIALALWLAVGTPSRLRTLLLGTVWGLIAANRQPDGLIAGAFILFKVWNDRRSVPWLLVGAAVPLAALMYYNLHFVGHYAGAYALEKPSKNFFQPGWKGIFGLLISPSRGLLVFSPFFAFLIVGLRQRLRDPGTKKLAVTLSLAVAAQFLVYSQMDWRAGESWGPRWLTDLLPILVWMLAPAPLILRPLGRGLLTLTMAASVAVQAIGAFWYTKVSDELIFATGSSMEGAWNIRNIPFLVELRHPPAWGELLCDAKGSLDRVGRTLPHSLKEIPKLESGAVLEGWALTGGRTPAQLIVLVDGVVIGETTQFLPRPDVDEALHTHAPSGWAVTASTQGVPPGKHVLQLAVRIGPRSDIRVIREQRVFVVAPEPPTEVTALPVKPVTGPELDAMAVRAAALLREQQSPQGFWLTAYTQGLRYEAPQPEMNTYLTSVLVDLLTPIAHPHGLDDVMERARRHLAAQIESNGLVRYHGLPDAPTIGSLGIVITPDADDTALVWRIAGPGTDDPRVKPMLKKLADYRDGRGLYRTWLAPQKEYQGLDPGRDPDPTDIGIQMHVYLMLRQFDPPAAKKLCKAIEHSFGDEDVWVYYARAPLIPYLRCAELNQLGCTLPLPSERLALPAAGQEIWSEAARLLVAMMMSPHDENARQSIRQLLTRLGSDDFARLRHMPPMLYHNDISATVKRYYWSEDFAYALWLRLYEAAGLQTPP